MTVFVLVIQLPLAYMRDPSPVWLLYFLELSFLIRDFASSILASFPESIAA